MEYKIPQEVEEMVCLVGGTGVACAMQVVKEVLDRGGRVRVVWAVRDGKARENGKGWWLFGGRDAQPLEENPTRNPMLTHLHHLKTLHPTNLAITTHMDNTPSALRPSTLLPLLFPPQNPPITPPKSPATTTTTADAKKLLLVAGPPGFVEYWVGAKVWDNSVGKEGQGGIGGVLGGEMIRRGEGKGEWVVWKL